MCAGGGMGSVAKIILDSETFKALASPTRLQVMRTLDERRKTVTELARDLELNKATVHEHLQILVATGLVRKRDDEGRKWVYYELTWQGERLLHPQETTTFMVLLGLSVAAAGGGVAMLGRALHWWWDGREASRGLEESGTGPADGDSADAPSDQAPALRAADDAGDDASAADTDGGAMWDEDGWISLALLATAILLSVLAFVLRRRPRPRGGAAKQNEQSLNP